MKLNKTKIGKLIRIVDEKNKIGCDRFFGINVKKEFMPTVANTDGLDKSKYKVVYKERFVYSGMQTGRDKCIRISMYDEDEPAIVSPAYTTFEVVDKKIVLPEYLFMFFISKEKDRLGWFLSDSSVRSNLDWDRFCDIDISLPDINIQKKYVKLYMNFKDNQKAIESSLELLKNSCNIYILNN